MFTRSLVSVFALGLTVASLTGCNSDNRSASDDSMQAKASAGAANNAACPVCGMPADARYSVTESSKTLNCCSQACCDKFNKATSAERQRMTNKVWRTDNHNSTDARDAYAESKTYANGVCPMDGKSVNSKYTVDVDGHPVGFCSQQCADLYRSYGPEHRAELRNRHQ